MYLRVANCDTSSPLIVIHLVFLVSLVYGGEAEDDWNEDDVSLIQALEDDSRTPKQILFPSDRL